VAKLFTFAVLQIGQRKAVLSFSCQLVPYHVAVRRRCRKVDCIDPVSCRRIASI